MSPEKKSPEQIGDQEIGMVSFRSIHNYDNIEYEKEKRKEFRDSINGQWKTEVKQNEKIQEVYLNSIVNEENKNTKNRRSRKERGKKYNLNVFKLYKEKKNIGLKDNINNIIFPLLSNLQETTTTNSDKKLDLVIDKCSFSIECLRTPNLNGLTDVIQISESKQSQNHKKENVNSVKQHENEMEILELKLDINVKDKLEDINVNFQTRNNKNEHIKISYQELMENIEFKSTIKNIFEEKLELIEEAENIQNKVSNVIFEQEKYEYDANENDIYEKKIDQSENKKEISKHSKVQIIENKWRNEKSKHKSMKTGHFENYLKKVELNNESFHLKKKENFENEFRETKIQSPKELDIDLENDGNEFNHKISIKNDNVNTLENYIYEDNNTNPYSHSISSPNDSQNDKDITKIDNKVDCYSLNILDNHIENKSVLSGKNIENLNSCMHLITEEENEDESSTNKENRADENKILLQDISDIIHDLPALDLENCCKHNYPRKHVKHHKTRDFDDFKLRLSKYHVKDVTEQSKPVNIKLNPMKTLLQLNDNRLSKKLKDIGITYSPNDLGINGCEPPSIVECSPLKFDNSVTCDITPIIGSPNNYFLQSQQTIIHISPYNTPQKIDNQSDEFECNQIDHISKGISKVMVELFTRKFR